MTGSKSKPLGFLFCCLFGVFSWVALDTLCLGRFCYSSRPGHIYISPFAVCHDMYQDAYGKVMLDGFLCGPDNILDMMKLSWESPSLEVALSPKYLRKGSQDIESA